MWDGWMGWEGKKGRGNEEKTGHFGGCEYASPGNGKGTDERYIMERHFTL